MTSQSTSTSSSIWTRIRLAWSTLIHGPESPHVAEWYQPLCALLASPLSHACRRAVEKVNLDKQIQKGSRYAEATRWAQIYAAEVNIYPPDTRDGSWNFLLEWWVAKTGGKF